MLLSVIIPLYNTGEYIAKCLDSVLAQGLRPEQYEIIVVNDGSTDSGPEIAEDYCNRHGNIKLITQENAGVSAARNRGLKEAQGEYVHFVDSDDYMEAGAYNQIFNVLLNGRTDCDIIKFHSVTVDKYADVEKLTNISESRILYEGDHHDQILKFGSFSTGVWTLLIRRSVIVNNGITFNVGVNTIEDLLFNLDLAKLTGLKVMVCNTNAYRYVLREGSIVTSRVKIRIKGNLSSYELVFDAYKKGEALLGERFAQCFRKTYVGISRLTATRLLSSGMSYGEIKEYIDRYYKTGIFPIDDLLRAHRIINWLTRHPKAFYVAGLLYRNIFLPYLKRFVPRN